jgi:ribosomal protein L33
MKIALVCDMTPWWSVEEFAYLEDGRRNFLRNVNNKLGAKRRHIRKFCDLFNNAVKNNFQITYHVKVLKHT